MSTKHVAHLAYGGLVVAAVLSGCASPVSAPAVVADGGDGGRMPCGLGAPTDPSLKGHYSENDLPKGRCTSNAEACDISAYELCPCNPTGYGGYSVFRCTCAAESWACAIISKAAQYCPRPGQVLCYADGGMDAGGD